MRVIFILVLLVFTLSACDELSLESPELTKCKQENQERLETYRLFIDNCVQEKIKHGETTNEINLEREVDCSGLTGSDKYTCLQVKEKYDMELGMVRNECKAVMPKEVKDKTDFIDCTPQSHQLESNKKLIKNDEKVVQEQQKVPVNECETKKSFAEKNNCYILEARDKKDTSICNKIGKDLAIKDCLLKVTFFLGSTELCKKLSDEIDKTACLFTVGYGKDLEFCNSLPDNDVEVTYIIRGGIEYGGVTYGGDREVKVKKKKCIEGYYSSIMEIEFKDLNYSFCDHFEQKNECLKKLAELKGDYKTLVQMCDTIWCGIIIAKNSKDPSLCDEAKNLVKGNYEETSYYKDILQCKDDIAIEKLNPDGCETPSCISNIAMELGDMTICFKGCKASSYKRLITGDGMVGFDLKGNTVGYDRKFTVDDCNTMKEKCSDCDVKLYDDCLIRAFRRDPNLKEQDCDAMSNNNSKKACIYEAYTR